METLRVIVVGAGGNRGAWFVEKLASHRDYQIVSLVDLTTQAAHVVAERCNLESIPVFSDLEAALAEVACDAVLVATPDCYHVDPVCSALRHGAYVYVEKPLAITLEDCLAIVRADEAAGGRTMVGFNLRFAPLYRQLRQMIREGAIGRLLTIQADEFYYGGRTYFRRWNRLRQYGGGLWITKASHDFDLLYWLSDALPQKVFASARLTHYVPKPEAGMVCHDCQIEPECADSHLKIIQSRPRVRPLASLSTDTGVAPDLCLFNSDKDTFDHGVAQVEFENDVLAVYTLNVVAPFTDRRIRIGGTEGTLQGSLNAPEVLYWRRHQDMTPDQAQRISLVSDKGEGSGHGGGDGFILDDFAAFARGEPSHKIGPYEASLAVAMGLAATRSSDTGHRVELSELAGWQALQALAG